MENNKIKEKYAPGNLRIAVMGGGNIGTQFACVCACHGYSVNVLSSRPQAYDGELEIVDENNKLKKGKINKVTSDIGEAVNGCGVVFVTYPADQLKRAADSMLPYITSDVNIGILPGTGGAEFAFRECIKAGASLFGLQRTPAVARLEKYGKRVRYEGLRDKLYLSSIPGGKADESADFISSLFGIPCLTLPNYLSVTLTPGNSILHTTRLRTLFKNYRDGMVYDRNPLFYGEWNHEASELLIDCDEELQQICRKLERLDLSLVQSLKIHYESETVEAMTEKLRSIKSLHNLSSPMKQVEKGWIPDFQSRYFTADFPYGLAIIKGAADILGLSCPNIRETMAWYQHVTGDSNEFRLMDYGIRTSDDIYSLYIE